MKYMPPATKEEQLFERRIEDLVRLFEARGDTRFSSFMNLRERQLAQWVVNRAGVAQCRFFGGDPACERVMLGLSWEPLEDAAFPIAALDFTASSPVGHRDVLGAVLGLGVTRETVGDIWVQENSFRIFASLSLRDFILTELREVGRSSVRSAAQPLALAREQALEEESRTIASDRLDNVVSAVTGASRAEAARWIGGGFVSVNHTPVEKLTLPVEAGDLLSIRGHGRFRVQDLSGRSRKGRVILRFQRFL